MRQIPFMALLKKETRGQSLVEMAIILPILIFMLIGVLEVGWVLRNYLVLANVNREITRFSVRPGYLDFSTKDNVIASYDRVRDWAMSAQAGQLAFDFNNNPDPNNTGDTTLIITHIVVDTGLPCEDIITNPDGCDCAQFMVDPDYGFTLDDIIIYPTRPGMDYQQGFYGPAQTVTGIKTSHINLADMLYNDNNGDGVVDDQNGMIPLNNTFNCELIKKGGIPSANNMIITEMFFDQPQLFGFPIISNPYTNPVPVYTHTSMRLIGAARSTGSQAGDLTAGIDTLGPICNAYPFMVHKDTIDYDNPTNMVGQTVDILDGTGTSGHEGWAAWNPGDTSQLDLEYQLRFSASSLNNFINPISPSDTVLSNGDRVASLPGKMQAVNDNHLLDDLVGTPMIVPVWDQFAGNNYRIAGFAWVQISSESGIDLANSKVEAIYLGDAAENCP